MPRQPNTKAEEAYLAAHAQANTTLDEIRELLFDLPAPESETHIHWGHVGVLSHVNSLLLQVKQFLAGENQ